MQMLDSQFRYGPAEHACVKDNGYYIFDHGLSTEGLAVCRERIDAMISQRHADVPPDMMISTHQQESWVFELATEPKLLDMIEDQIGPTDSGPYVPVVQVRNMGNHIDLAVHSLQRLLARDRLGVTPQSIFFSK